MAGDWRRASWVMCLCAIQLFILSSNLPRQKSGGQTAAPRSAKRWSCRTFHPGGWMSKGRGLAGMQSHFVAFSLWPRGIFRLSWVALLHAPFARDLLQAEKDKTVIRTAQVAISVQATRWISRKKQDRSIWFKAFTKSTIGRHRLSSWSCFRSQRLMVWTMTMASQPFSVPNPSCVGRGYRVISSETEASRGFAERRRRVSPMATGLWLLSFSFEAASEALAVQEVMGTQPHTTCCHDDKNKKTTRRHMFSLSLGSREISVLVQLTLRHQRCHLRCVLPQPDSPHKSTTHGDKKKRHTRTHAHTHARTPSQVISNSRMSIKLNRVFSADFLKPVPLAVVSPSSGKGQTDAQWPPVVRTG